MNTEQIDLKELLAVKQPNTLITTTKGLMKVGDLTRKVVEFEDNNELTYNIQYWLDDEMVHESVHIQLKEGVDAESEAAQF